MKRLPKSSSGFGVVGIIVVLVIVCVIGGGVWYIKVRHDNKNVSAVSHTQTTPSTASSTSPVLEPQTPGGKTAQVVNGIEASLNKGGYLGLEAYMADRVSVVKQSSDDAGPLSKSAAASLISSDLTKSGVSLGADLPWDFSATAVGRNTINKATGAIAAYKSQGYIGISANNWVVAFNLNSGLQINSFYMSGSLDAVQ